MPLFPFPRRPQEESLVGSRVVYSTGIPHSQSIIIFHRPTLTQKKLREFSIGEKTERQVMVRIPYA